MNFMEGAEETKPKISQKKERRSRKPMFEEVCKPRKVTNYKKKKDKKRKRIELGLEEFREIKFAEIRAKNQQHKEFIAEIELGLEELRLKFGEVRATIQQLKEIFSETDDCILAMLASF